MKRQKINWFWLKKAKENIKEEDTPPKDSFVPFPRTYVDPLSELQNYIQHLYDGYFFVKTFEDKLTEYRICNKRSEISSDEIVKLFIEFLTEENNKKLEQFFKNQNRFF